MRLIWSLYAMAYDVLTKLVPYRDQLEDIYRALTLTGTERVLDVGCGTGNVSCFLKSRRPGLQLCLVEPCRAMMKRAQRKLRDDVGVEFHQGSLETARLSGAFDRVLAINVLYCIPKEESSRMISDLLSLMPKGGVLVVSDPAPESTWMAIAKGHVVGLNGRGLFGQLAAAMGMLVLIPEVIWVALANVAIEVFLRKGIYTFRSEAEWRDEFPGTSVTVTRTYASQNWLLTIRKEP